MITLPAEARRFAKSYKCSACGAHSRHLTNHYGSIKAKCNGCGGYPVELLCLDPAPKNLNKAA